MKKIQALFLLLLVCCGLKAQNEKLLVNENFQTWNALNSSSTEVNVIKTTDFSNEEITYTLKDIQVAPEGVNSKFNSEVVSMGYLMCAKKEDTYIELSALSSITRVEFVHAATGSNRGYMLWKKVGTGEWTLVSDAVANPASGSVVAVEINEENVALKFTNINAQQNAYLTDLKIYGNYSSSALQVTLNTSQNIAAAGTITRSVNSDTYDQGTALTLTATPNFGYRFVRWEDSANQPLSDNATFSIVLNTDISVVAIFEIVNTYAFDLQIAGSRWGEIELTPLPVDGKYEEGTTVTATVVSNRVSTFSYWENMSNSSSRIIVMDENKSITATFDEIPFIVGWDFRTVEPRVGRNGDYYSESDNTGMLNLHKNDGSTVSWLGNTGSFTPSYPCARVWTSGTDFNTERRYFQASFSTIGYKNISVNSMVSANYQSYSIIKMQYSLDGVDFKDLNSTDITSVYNSGWADCNATLPTEAENVQKIYIRWFGDTSSTLLGNSTDSEGTALTNIFIFADKEIIEDNESPVLLSSVPSADSNTASINGTITLTFNERLKDGVGNITLNGVELTPVFGSKTVSFKYSGLSYNTDYTLSIPEGALVDLSENLCSAINLTFKTMDRQQPVAKVFDFVVAKDGTGDGLTVQEAINAAPADAIRYLIFIKNGKYEERPSISATKKNISLIGQSIDDVIISAGVYANGPEGASTSTSQTLEVLGNNIYMENLTIENTAGVNAGQAVALKDYGKYNTYKNVRLLGNQDTHLTGNSAIQYYLNCDIRGTVDFIFGGGDIFFDNCLLYCNGRSGGDVIVAPSTLSSTQWGYVFRDCTIDGDKSTQNGVYQLGRPWQNAPRTVYINTTMKIVPIASGWTNMGVIPVLFAEYNSMNENGQSIDLSNRKSEYTTSASNGSVTVGGLQTELTDAEAATYTLENILRNDEEWMPQTIVEAVSPPVIKNANGRIEWENIDYAISYIVLRDGDIVAFVKDNFYQPLTKSVSTYAVIAVAEYGALSAMSNLIEHDTTVGIQTDEESSVSIIQSNGSITIDNIPANSTVRVYSLNGILLIDEVNVSGNITFAVGQNVIIQVYNSKKSEVFKVLKK